MKRETVQTHHKPNKGQLYDKPLLLTVLFLMTIGLVMVASSSIVISEKLFHQPFHYFYRQVTFLGLGLVAAAIIFQIKVKYWQTLGFLFLFSSLLLLVLVLVPGIGRSVNGSARWIGLGSFALQVSEYAKFAVVIYLSSYLVRRQEEVQADIVGFIKPLLILGVYGVLLLGEPDFGATVVILVTVMGMMFMAGVKLRHFIVLISIVLVLVGLIAISSPYRMLRLTTFLHPWANQFGSGYQLTQSLIAFGRGGVTGVGLGQSIQKLFYLPEAHTDFLFAVLAEEFGLLGAGLVIILFGVLIYRGFRIGRRAEVVDQLFSAYVAYGIALWMGMQCIVNIGVNMGVLPTKGLTLPLMSYGGSSLLINCMAIALLLRIDYEVRIAEFGLQSFKPFRQKWVTDVH